MAVARLSGGGLHLLAWAGGRISRRLDHRCGQPSGLALRPAHAFAPCRERLLETVAQGKAFCDVVGHVWDRELAGLTYPVALGRAAAIEELPLEMTLTLYLQAFISNLVSAAQRLGPIGQTEAQQVIRALAPTCAETATEACDGNLSHIASATFLSDIASMKHETQYSRIFRS